MPIPYAIHHFIRCRCHIILFSFASMGLTIAPSPGLDIDIVSEVARTMRKDLIDSGANPDFTLAEYLIPGIGTELRMKLFASNRLMKNDVAATAVVGHSNNSNYFHQFI